MYWKGLGLTLFLLFSFFLTRAQTTRDVATPKPPAPRYQAEKKKDGAFAKLFKKEPTSDKEAFRQRMKNVAKEKRKEEKLAQKPQYSDPQYFGHKKPPKKRPVGKRKFCKVCHIVH